LKTLRINFDRHETRRDRRYALPPISVTLGNSRAFAIANWSLGGFLLDGGPRYAVGDTVAGKLAAGGQSFDFSAEVARRGPDGTGFRFVDLSPAMVGALDRVVVGRMFRKKRA
jgi:hypothetical protein